ncbi:sensor histidine kinase [Allorhizocola rhizosphaerae]|uniref:sensor histidine kinase n=1 Tax=Allorhizocola rhizosphaerae TaxID=1872709 RepID=UPI001FE4BE1B|nr:histidine kinase [Allorhizocola rhizosphaerae]
MTRLRALSGNPRMVDAALVAACLFLTALAVKTPWSTLPLTVVAVAGVLGSVAQWPRRRRPVVAAVAGTASYALSGNPGPWMIGLYASAAHPPRRPVWGWISGVAGWAGFFAQSWIDGGRPRLDDALSALLATGFVVMIGRYVAARGELLSSMHDRAQRIETERRLRDEQARAAERDRIARELHDVLAHKVSLIALYAGALELHAGGSPRLQEGTALIRATAREALQEMRHVLGLLHAGPESARQQPSDLATLVQASIRAGQRVKLHHQTGTLPPATARTVYRIVQEGLTNAHKHAPDAPITVVVSNDDGNVMVKVRNGSGAAAPMDLPGSGSGLVGLAERIRLAGGSLRSGPLDAEDGAGWELCAVVPLTGEAP